MTDALDGLDHRALMGSDSMSRTSRRRSQEVDRQRRT